MPTTTTILYALFSVSIATVYVYFLWALWCCVGTDDDS